MATSLRCPNCQATLGKDVENPKVAHCGECNGHTFYNPYGYSENTEDEREFIRQHKKKSNIRYGRIITRY